MKRILYSIGKSICGWLTPVVCAAMVAATIASCHTIFDSEGDCQEVESVEHRVKFVYDYHMKYADAFPHEVRSVALYVFDEADRFVGLYTDSGEALGRAGYTMALDLAPGAYRFVVWAGLDEGRSFEVPNLQPGVSTSDDLTCRMRRYTPAEATETLKADSVGYLAPLWHGTVQTDVFRATTTTATKAAGQVEADTVTVSLTKDTNTLRVILQQLSDRTVNVDDDRFTVTDDNGLMDAGNALLPDVTLTYGPYYTAQGSAETGEETLLNMAVAELSVGRLMADHNPVLSITRKGDPEVTVLSIPLIRYLELCKTVAHYDMGIQEYLDREDEYSMTFFLDADNNWLETQIIINDWIVRFNDITAD